MNTTLRSFSSVILTAFCIALFFSGCAKKDEKAAQSVESRVDSLLGGAAAKDTTAAATTSTAPAANLNDKAKAGEKLFLSASLGEIKVSCAMCHGGAGAKAGVIRPGHTIAGVTKRPSTWNGMFKGADLAKNAYGGSLCATLFQEKKGGLSAAEVASLNEYLTANESAPGAINSALNIQWAAKPSLKKDVEVDEKISKPIVKAIMKLPGDVSAGEKVFMKSCANCHDFKVDKSGPALKDAATDMNFVAASVRFGSNAMPFFAKDILTDQQIADVIGYIQATLGK